MKKVLCIILSLTIAIFGLSSFMFASNFDETLIEDAALYPIEVWKIPNAPSNVSGNLPYFRGDATARSAAVFAYANNKVSKFYNDTLMAAASRPGANIAFRYSELEDATHLSIVLYSTTTWGNNNRADDIETIVVAKSDYRVYPSLINIIGPNGYKMVDEYVKDQFSQQSAYYSSYKFEGTNANTLFYVNAHSDLVIVLRNHQASSTYAGPIELTLDLSYIINHNVLSTDYYFTQDGVMMVPLASVLRAFAYETIWDGTATVRKDGTSFVLTSGVNNYNGLAYEAAPEIKEGRMYVPTTFISTQFGIYFTVNKQIATFSKLLYSRRTTASATMDSSYSVAVGSILTYASNALSIRTSASTLTFDTIRSNITSSTGLTAGKTVIVIYEDTTPLTALFVIIVE